MKRPVLLLFIHSMCFLSATRAPKYRCTPCGHNCDSETFAAPGSCPQCRMPLVGAETITFGRVAPEALCNWIEAHPAALLLDVRTPEEFSGKADPDFGALKNAINIPVQQLRERMGELDPYKNKDILVYCSHSHRSSEASYQLSQAGFKKITNMSGGISTLGTDASCRR